MAVAPPKPKDLSLTALRAFEAAARLGGFAAAAEELGVSPGAVTAHVKALEDRLGAVLFQRDAKGVRLTALGQRVLPALSEAFDHLAAASHHLQAEAAPQLVHIATLPAIAQFWLSPRLPELRRIAPEISVSITAMEAPPNLKRAPYDLCLFFGGSQGVALAEDVIFPVCAPSVAARVRSVADVANLPCLSDTAWSEDWALWLATAQPGGGITPRGPAYSLYALAVEEAVNGAGVLIGHEALVARHLAAGRLVAPFPERATTGRNLRLWPAAPAGPAARRVMRWLTETA